MFSQCFSEQNLRKYIEKKPISFFVNIKNVISLCEIHAKEEVLSFQLPIEVRKFMRYNYFNFIRIIFINSYDLGKI